MNNSNVSILVSSCDKYEEAWVPFFTLLSNYWRNCCFDKYLLTESKNYTDFGVKTINCSYKAWSSRLLYALNEIETEYVLFMLDDFFVMGEVDDEAIRRYISFMDNDSGISSIYLKTSTGQTKISSKYPELIKMEPGRIYYLNFQAGLWRRRDMMNVIQPGLSPWDIEEKADWNIPGIFYCVRNSSYTNTKNDVIPYLWALKSGYGICKSKWLWNNPKLFKKEGINCRCETLPLYRKSSYLFDKYFRNFFR